MNDFRNDILSMRKFIMDAYQETDRLLAMSDGAPMSNANLQQSMERIAAQFEWSTLELRCLCEKYSPGVGSYPKHTLSTTDPPVGSVRLLEGRWVQITLNTLLPHCRYQAPIWLTDTIRRLLDEFEAAEGRRLPCHPKVILMIDERCNIGGRHIFDQDNKGWKAVSNAIKGRLVPDDDQYSMGIVLRSSYSEENRCLLSVVPVEDAPVFFAAYLKGQQILP